MLGSDSFAVPLQKKKNTSGYVGVCLNGIGQNYTWYCAKIRVNNTVAVVGGSYATIEAGARAYDRALIAHCGRGVLGKRSGYNFPLESYPVKVSHYLNLCFSVGRMTKEGDVMN